MPVGELGPDDVVTGDRDATLTDIAETLESENVGAVVVTEDDEPVGLVTDRDVALAVAHGDDDGKLESIVTVDDLVGTVGEQLDEVADTIEAQSPDYSP